MAEVIHYYPSKIIIDNFTHITNSISNIYKKLSVWNEVTFNYSFRAFFINEETEQLMIPRGFNQEIINSCYENHIAIVEKANKYDTIELNATVDPRDKQQENAIHYLLSDTAFHADTADCTQKFLCLKTGHGKTFCTINAITKLKKKPIIIVDMDRFISQWKDEFLKFTDIKEEEIYIISGRDTISRIENNKLKVEPKVYIASHRTLNSYIKNDNYEDLDNLFKVMGVGLKVFDEAHVEWMNVFYIDSFTNVSETWYLTATPSRSNPKEDTVYNNMYEMVPKYGLEKKYNEPYHNIVYVTWNTYPDNREIARMKSKYGFNISKYNDYLISPTKIDMFLDFVDKIILPQFSNKVEKIAIIVQQNNMIEVLKEHFSSILPNDKTIGIFTTLTEKSIRNDQLNCNLILTTIKSFNKGVDVKGLESVVNLVPTSSKTVAEQAVGRLRKIPGKKVVYYDISDKGFVQCMHQRSSRKKVLDKIAKRTYEISL